MTITEIAEKAIANEDVATMKDVIDELVAEREEYFKDIDKVKQQLEEANRTIKRHKLEKIALRGEIKGLRFAIEKVSK